MQHGIARLVKGHFQLVDWFKAGGDPPPPPPTRFCNVYQENINGLEWNDNNCNAPLTYYWCTTVQLAHLHLNSASRLTSSTKNLKFGLRDLNVHESIPMKESWETHWLGSYFFFLFQTWKEMDSGVQVLPSVPLPGRKKCGPADIRHFQELFFHKSHFGLRAATEILHPGGFPLSSKRASFEFPPDSRLSIPVASLFGVWEGE